MSGYYPDYYNHIYDADWGKHSQNYYPSYGGRGFNRGYNAPHYGNYHRHHNVVVDPYHLAHNQQRRYDLLSQKNSLRGTNMAPTRLDYLYTNPLRQYQNDHTRSDLRSSIRRFRLQNDVDHILGRY